MNQIEQLMALHETAVEREVEYREALRIDVGVREAGMKSAEADQALRAAIEAALTPGEINSTTLMSSTSDTALLRQALEALEWCEPAGTVGHGGIQARKQAIAALKERLQ